VDNNSGNRTSLAKAGTGTWTISGNNTYTGVTTINGGTLSITGNISTSNATVNTGATITGTGRVGMSPSPRVARSVRVWIPRLSASSAAPRSRSGQAPATPSPSAM
jgi:autotransporter-associated beta strand protein